MNLQFTTDQRVEVSLLMLILLKVEVFTKMHCLVQKALGNES